MIDARFQPLVQWPRGEMRPAHKRKASPFGATYGKILKVLERELNHLSAKEIVIQAGFEMRQIRNDGWPYAAARPKHPAVVLSFVARGGKKVMMPCDTYTSFEENLRAITLTLVALRAINRYGVTEHEEQYAGFTPLAAPGTESEMSREAAERMVAGLAGVTVEAFRDSAQREVLVRQAKRMAHPDHGEGSHETFVQLTKALEVLGYAA